MTQVCFVVGHDHSPDSPSDTPEAYWRVALPAKHLGGRALILGAPGTEKRALESEVIWIHQPTSNSAAALAEMGRQAGRRIVVDFSEDIWARAEINRSYQQARLDAAERALAVASLVVVTSASLVPAYADFGVKVQVVRPVVPLGPGWEPRVPAYPPIIGWWSDGRQKSGFEIVAPGLRQLLDDSDTTRIYHYQFPDHAPLMVGADGQKAKDRAGRLGAFLEGLLPADANLAILRDRFAVATISLDCYPPGEYGDTVSDLPILRAAALGIPTITTRSLAPPGVISAAPNGWAETIQGVLTDPGQRRGLSLSARAWAETRSTYDAYQDTIAEVLTSCLFTT